MDPVIYANNSFLEEIKRDDDDEDDDEDERKSKRSRSSATPFSQRNGRKRSRTSVYETAASSTAEGMIALGDSIKEANAMLLAPRQTRFDQCLELLNKMLNDEKISTQDYFRITSFFMKNEQHTALFVGMSENIRIKWLNEENLLDNVEQDS
jgi:hypothetical protein